MLLMTILQVFRIDRELSIVLFHRMVLFHTTVSDNERCFFVRLSVRTLVS